MSATPHPAGPPREMLAPRHESLRKEFDNLLPGYGEARLWIVARDSHWLFAYWEFDPTEHPGVRGADGTEHVFLRVTREDGEVDTTMEILPSVGHWYVPVSQPDCGYSAELGYFTTGGVWAFVARSGTTRTPPLEGLPRSISGIRPPPPPKPQPPTSGTPEWGVEEEKMLGRLIAAESAKASGVRRPPRRTTG